MRRYRARPFAIQAAQLLGRAIGAGLFAITPARILIDFTTFVEVLLALKNLPHLPLNLKHKMNAIVVVNLFIAAYNGYK